MPSREMSSCLNNLNISTSYNLAGDSLNCLPLALGEVFQLPEKLDINFGTNLDIYALNNNNRRIDKLNINNGGSLFRMTNANVSFGYSFSSQDFSAEKKMSTAWKTRPSEMEEGPMISSEKTWIQMVLFMMNMKKMLPMKIQINRRINGTTLVFPGTLGWPIP